MATQQTRQQELEALIREAMKQPGVAEAMEVYGQVDRVQAAAGEVSGEAFVHSSSDHTATTKVEA